MTKEEPPERNGDESQQSRSLFDRISQAILGEPSSREDLVDMLREAYSRGLIDRDSLDMIEGVFQVSEMKARDIMIPRGQMEVVDKDAKPEEYLPMIINSGHSRFPMIDGNKDRVIGILLAKDLLRYFQLDKKKRSQFNLQDMLRPAVFAPESKRLNVLLRDFRVTRNHMAIVVDEFGGVAGIVTIEDVLEQIVGEIADEYDFDDDAMILPRENGEYVIKALLPLEEFNERFSTSYKDEEIDTIGGLVMNAFGHLPKRGERVVIDSLIFEVLRADSRRIHLMKIIPRTDPAKRAVT
jgi:magnesium and cobalt transporter